MAGSLPSPLRPPNLGKAPILISATEENQTDWPRCWDMMDTANRHTRYPVTNINQKWVSNGGNKSCWTWLPDVQTIHERKPKASDAWVSLHAECKLLKPISLILQSFRRVEIEAAVYAEEASQSTHSRPLVDEIRQSGKITKTDQSGPTKPT